MAGFSSTFDGLRSAIAALSGFTTKTELANPYDLTANAIGRLRDGWGLKVGESNQGEAEFNSIVDQHVFSIVLTREVISTENDPTSLIAALKNLKTDSGTLQQQIETDLAVANCEWFRYVSTTGVEFGSTNERHKWITVTVNFIASIRENLT
jgi:hypothetical protein